MTVLQATDHQAGPYSHCTPKTVPEQLDPDMGWV
jgi:hypothetical protein